MTRRHSDDSPFQTKNRFGGKPRKLKYVGIKTCSTCKQVKANSEFYGPYTSLGNYVERYSAKCRSCQKTCHYAKYGLSPEQYQARLQQQDGCCAICKQPEKSGRQLSIDHDHATGAVRGLLCIGCNSGLGGFRDNPALLLVAIKYLATPGVK